jgi:fatty-acyl-CoA synthase
MGEAAPVYEAPLSPTFFLGRAAEAFADRTAIRDRGEVFTYREFAERSQRLSGGLMRLGIRQGDRVAALCTNSHVMLEAHFGVPSSGGVLVPLNTRLSVPELADLVRCSGARLIIVTEELAETASAISCATGVPVVGEADGAYETFLAGEAAIMNCADERSLLAISYTSGSTGVPKGVMYSHRGAYLQSLAMAFQSRFSTSTVYLWTLPMFHCNGWACTWAVTAAGGVHVCARSIDGAQIWQEISAGGVTHLSGAPTVLLMIADAAEAPGALLPSHWVHASTGGAPPSPALLERMSRLRIQVTHLYGLTETYGPAVVNEWQPEWSALTPDVQAQLNARQGIGNVVTSALSVIDELGDELPFDGTSIGEIALRGNNVMLGYFNDEEATRAAFAGGWFRTGDLGVRHPDGYIELKDRAKDIIISGGENIASVEIEQILMAHPAVAEAAVVARPDSKWGEVPVAFVALRPGTSPDSDELIRFVEERTARFKAPKAIVFGELPKTSTGKIEKHRLRERLRQSPGE